MRICYTSKRFSPNSLVIIGWAIDIVTEYAKQGYALTLRQLYYQFVARDLIANRQAEYKRLGSIVADARLAGLIDWEAIEDRSRNIHCPSTWDNPAEIVHTCAEQYKLDLWADQTYRPEVWIEKEALLAIAERACEPERVPYFACKGYVSQSEMWNAGGRRLLANFERGQTPVILHLGDHDPSGIDMTRDIADRLALFAEEPVIVRRLALNFDQVEQYRPPPNPAKVTDSRFDGYAATHGTESWELDALPPDVLVQLLQEEIAKLRDDRKWTAFGRREKRDRKALTAIADRYDVAKKAAQSKPR